MAETVYDRLEGLCRRLGTQPSDWPCPNGTVRALRFRIDGQGQVAMVKPSRHLDRWVTEIIHVTYNNRSQTNHFGVVIAGRSQSFAVRANGDVVSMPKPLNSHEEWQGRHDRAAANLLGSFLNRVELCLGPGGEQRRALTR